MGNWNPDVLTFPDYYCSGFMLMEMMSREEKTQLAGVTIIVDGANFAFKQARNLSLDDLKYSARTLQVGAGTKLHRRARAQSPPQKKKNQVNWGLKESWF